jgi:hypothetical protein
MCQYLISICTFKRLDWLLFMKWVGKMSLSTCIGEGNGNERGACISPAESQCPAYTHIFDKFPSILLRQAVTPSQLWRLYPHFIWLETESQR